MTPIVTTTNIYTPPATIVASVVPGNNSLRLNADNVPPTVSNVQINNNNKNNNNVLTPNASSAQISSATSGGGFSLSPFIYTTPTSLSAGAQNTFIAQLISQDSSAQTQAVLQGYEQLVAYGNVKYLPSNASLPEPEPANLFVRALQQERQTVTTQQAATQQVASKQQATTAATSTVANNAPITRESAPLPRTEPARPTPTTSKSSSTTIAINAYVAVAARNDANLKKNSDTPIEAV